MAALIEDAKAMAIGLFLSIGVSLVFCMLSVGLISWSALRQVSILHNITPVFHEGKAEVSYTLLTSIIKSM